MPHAYTENQIVEQRTIDEGALNARGWVTFGLASSCEVDLCEQLVALAAGLGTPTATRFGGGLYDTLSPTETDAAKPQSLSKIHDFGEFPLHVDTAHWPTPCRYVMLACVSPGSADRPTFILDTWRLPLTDLQTSLLHSTPLRVTNGRNSFFSTILSKSRSFVRFDPGCMTSTSTDGSMALAVLSRENWSDYIETVDWQAGKVVVINNWRLLHGRSQADHPDKDRKLLRISIR
jgi:hypothetical protein